MSASSSDHDLIRNILPATDLSARGDRALGRAVALAAECHANLIVVHAFEEFSESSLTYDRHPQPSWRAPADAANIAKLRIREALEVDLGGVLSNELRY